MKLEKEPSLEIRPILLEAIESFPLRRVVGHCGAEFGVSPFDIYASCPICGTKIKVRSFGGGGEIEDVFDAVISWMSKSGAADLIQRRQLEINADSDD